MAGTQVFKGSAVYQERERKGKGSGRKKEGGREGGWGELESQRGPSSKSCMNCSLPEPQSEECRGGGPAAAGNGLPDFGAGG